MNEIISNEQLINLTITIEEDFVKAAEERYNTRLTIEEIKKT